MKRFIEGEDRRQATSLPDCLEDYVSDENPVRVIEAFIDELDLKALGFDGVVPRSHGTAFLSSGHAVEDLSLWLFELPVELQARTGNSAQHRIDVADGPLDARFQNHRRFPPRQRPRDPCGLLAVRPTASYLPPSSG